MGLIHGDSEIELKKIDDCSIDFLCSDPPYGYSFMGKDWDKSTPKQEIFNECFRVLKHGSFACFMSSPRLDCLGEMSVKLKKAGFLTHFTTISWVYGTGFPKASNISKQVDKKLGCERKREKRFVGDIKGGACHAKASNKRSWEMVQDNESISPEAKSLDGSYAGYQPKPAQEFILVVMKPLSEKNYTEQALKDGKGISWLKDGFIPCNIEKEDLARGRLSNNDTTLFTNKNANIMTYPSTSGRFSPNILCQDDVLNTGEVSKSSGGSGLKSQYTSNQSHMKYLQGERANMGGLGDSGSFSRFFDLDLWFSERLKLLPESVQKKLDKEQLLTYNMEENINNYTEVYKWVARIAEEELGLKNKNMSVCNVEKNLKIMQVIEQAAEHFVLQVVLLNSDLESLCQNVKGVGKKLKLIETSIVPKLVPINQGLEILIEVRNISEKELITHIMLKDTIQIDLKPVHTAKQKIENCRDTILILTNRLKSFGYASNVITEPMLLDLRDILPIQNLPKSVQLTFPNIVTPKPSKAEKNKGCEGWAPRCGEYDEPLDDKCIEGTDNDNSYMGVESAGKRKLKSKNTHVSVKPIKLMSYLITIFSREGDVVLDPFMGSNTTGIAAKILRREYIGIEMDAESHKIAEARIKAWEPEPVQKGIF